MKNLRQMVEERIMKYAEDFQGKETKFMMGHKVMTFKQVVDYYTENIEQCGVVEECEDEEREIKNWIADDDEFSVIMNREEY